MKISNENLTWGLKRDVIHHVLCEEPIARYVGKVMGEVRNR